MATIQEKLSESLGALKKYQDAHGDNLVIQGADTLGRTHTERLVNSGYLQMVIKGWYIPSSPGSEGDSTVWYVSYWSFITVYLDSRFDGKWCLSPELSLYFHSGNTLIPKQLIVRSESERTTFCNCLSEPLLWTSKPRCRRRWCGNLAMECDCIQWSMPY